MKPTEAQIDALRQRHIGGHTQGGGDAINYLHGLIDGYIDGLEQSDWLPYPEHEPQEHEECFVTLKLGAVRLWRYSYKEVWRKEVWRENVIAYMPKPQPYRKEAQG